MSEPSRMESALMDAPEVGFTNVWKVGCDIERELNAANDRIRLLIAERDTARQQSDQKVSLREEFRELLGTDDIEQGITVVCDLKQLASVRLGYIKQLETDKEAANDMFRKLNIHALNLTDRIKRLEEALKCLTLVVGLTPIVGNKDALQEAMDIAISELQAKEDKL